MRLKILILTIITIGMGILVNMYSSQDSYALAPGDDVKDQIQYAVVRSHEDHQEPGATWFDTYFNVDLQLVRGSWLNGYYGAGNLWNGYSWMCVETRVWWPPEGVEIPVSWAIVQWISGDAVAIKIHLDPTDGTQDIEGTIIVPLFDAHYYSKTSATLRDSSGQSQSYTTEWDRVIETPSMTVNQSGEQDTDRVQVEFSHILHRSDDGIGVMTSAWWNTWDAQEHAIPGAFASLGPGWVIDIPRRETINRDVGLGQTEHICRWLDHPVRTTAIRSTGTVINHHDDERNRSGICANFAHPYNFKLTDDIALDGDVVYAGQYASAQYNVYNESNRGDIAHTASPDWTQLRLVSFTTNINEASTEQVKGGIVPGGRDDPSNLCSHFSNNGLAVNNCNTDLHDPKDQINKQIRPEGFSGERNDIPVPDNLDVSDTNNKFCVAIAVNPSSSKPDGDGTSVNEEWVVSNASCRTIAKKPSAEFKSGNLYSANGIVTSTTEQYRDGKTYGSWAEYLAISKLNSDNKDEYTIKGLSSGAKFKGGLAGTGLTPCNYSPLSIANANCPGKLPGKANIDSGNFLDQIMTFFKDKAGITPGIEFYSDEHPITSNIQIEGSFQQKSQVPQHIIIAKDITIDPSVTRIDAWLIAYGEEQNGHYTGGTIRTNGTAVIGTMAATNLDKPIQINGPVVAKTLALNRPYGSIGNSAEIFNLTPAAYIWGHNQDTTNGDSRAHTVYTREVAPRL